MGCAPGKPRRHVQRLKQDLLGFSRLCEDHRIRLRYAEGWRSCRYVTGIRKIEVLATTPNILECPISSYASMNHAPLGRLVSDSNNMRN